MEINGENEVIEIDQSSLLRMTTRDKTEEETVFSIDPET